MKRLLLAPLLVALAGCSSDIVVETDISEKYIVKKRAVINTSFERNLDDLISLVEEKIDIDQRELKYIKNNFYKSALGKCIENPHPACDKDLERFPAVKE